VTELFRRGPFRLAIIFMLAVSVTTLMGVGVVYWNVSTVFEARRTTLVAGETAAFLNDNQSRLRDDLASWLTNGLLLYSVAGLFDPNGAPLAGNLTAIPPGLPLDGKVHDFELSGDLIKVHEATDVPQEVLIAGSRRPDGTVLVLGRTLTDVSAVRRQVLFFGLLGLAVVLLLSLGIGLRANAKRNHRLKHLQQTLTHVMEGALNQRLPVTRERDDLDRLAQGVNRMLDMLETLLSEVKGVGDNIAHDLRTPLSVMRAKMERVLASRADAPSLRSTMASSLADLDRALTTITALLRLAEIENGQRRAGFKTMDLAQVCRDAFEFYEPLAEERRIRLMLDVPDHLPIQGDADLFAEAVTNLVDNAIKFTPEGGEVSIATWNERETLILSVADSGPGIPPADWENVGKRFYRADKSRNKPGTGLGLSLARAIAELHGFVLSVGDNKPRGAVVALARLNDSGF
jgi:hypothetical protein